MLRVLPVEQIGQLEIPMPTFQETDRYELHRARTTGKRSFQNGASQNYWVWVAVGSSSEFGALRGKLPRRLRGLFKLRANAIGNTKIVHRLAVVEILQAQPNGGRIVAAQGLVKVTKRRNTNRKDEFWIVNNVTILSLAHLIPEGDGQWLVNSWIDLGTFNEIY